MPDKRLDLVDQACAAARFRTLTPPAKESEGETRQLRGERGNHGRVAEFLFHDDKRLIHFDMSEFMDAHSVAKLIGAPPGYVEHDECAQLSDAIRTHHRLRVGRRAGDFTG